MKPLLAKIAIQKAVGVAIGEHEIAVSQVALTPAGVVEIARDRQPYAADELGAVLARMLAPLAGGKQRRRMSLAVGLPVSKLFFSTRSFRGSEGDAQPEVLLQKALQSPTISVEDLAVDSLRTDLSKVPATSIAACRKKYLSGVLAALDGCGVRPLRVEPIPCALVRAAARRRLPRRAKTILRVFLAAGHGLAVFVASGVPLAWRPFALPARGEGHAILSAIRTLRTLHKHQGVGASLDFVVVHGRANLQARLREEEFPAAVGTRVVWQDGPCLDDGAAAFGLALGCLSQNNKSFDLSRTMKPPASVWEIFPWTELVFQVSLLAILWLVLASHAGKLEEAYSAVRAESGRHKCLAGASAEQLEKEKKDLTQKTEAVYKFLDTRILWTAYTRDIAVRLPAEAVLNVFQGMCELDQGGKKKETASVPKKSLLLRASAPILPDGSVARDIDTFLAALRNHPLLKRDFPLVQLADIKRSDTLTAGAQSASFTVICLPKVAKVAESSEGKEGKEGGKKEE